MPSTEATQKTIPRTCEKIKYKGKGPTVTGHKKEKSHKVFPVYNLTDNEIDIIDYQI
jgi:hypothetical protein